MKNVEQLFKDFATIKVGVIGDVMLDTYLWGHVDRISPEAPVPVVLVNQKEQRIGGAGNVALNLRSLGSQAFVISITGNDEEGRCLRQLFTQNGIDTTYCLSAPGRITTNKTRIISRNQQMMRMDTEVTDDITSDEEEALLQKVAAFIATESPQIIILEDYNKGLLTAHVIEKTIALCKQNKVLTAVDPKRKNFFAYRGVDIFKPNLKEVKDALNILFTTVDVAQLEKIHAALHQQLQHHISFITLSEKGVYYQQQDKGVIIPSHIRNIADVSGAGDTVIAVAALVYAAQRDEHLMAEIANIAGGLVCEEVGTAAINKEALLHECQLLLS